jgi:hypothetical protein
MHNIGTPNDIAQPLLPPCRPTILVEICAAKRMRVAKSNDDRMRATINNVFVEQQKNLHALNSRWIPCLIIIRYLALFVFLIAYADALSSSVT